MVERQIAARGVRSELVLEAMRKIRREEFLPPHLREFAYEDTPLPIAEGQTISQPYIAALMAEALLPLDLKQIKPRQAAGSVGLEGAGERVTVPPFRGRRLCLRSERQSVSNRGAVGGGFSAARLRIHQDWLA
jgi:hypothetical protein